MAEENTQPTPEAPLQVPDPRDAEIQSMKMNMHVLQQSLETTNQMLQSVLAGRQQPQQVAPQRRGPVTEEELEEAFQNGRGAAKLKEFVSDMGQELIEQHINPLRQTGLEAIASNTMEMLRPKMPHYDRFKKEVDTFLNAYPPDLRVNAQAIKAAYDTGVGSHLDELAEERVQQHVRQASAPVVKPGASQRGRRDEGEVREADDIAPGALSGVGRSEEEFARKLGYKSWAEYQKVGEEA
jgi:hypothetical protein